MKISLLALNLTADTFFPLLFSLSLFSCDLIFPGLSFDSLEAFIQHHHLLLDPLIEALYCSLHPISQEDEDDVYSECTS